MSTETPDTITQEQEHAAVTALRNVSKHVYPAFALQLVRALTTIGWGPR